MWYLWWRLVDLIKVLNVVPVVEAGRPHQGAICGTCGGG